MLRFEREADDRTVRDFLSRQHRAPDMPTTASERLWHHVLFSRDLEATIIRDDDGSPYLLRVYLTGRSPAGTIRTRPAVWLHHFFRSDADREVHSHPFRWSLSVILSGGYIEHRWDRRRRRMRVRTLRRGSVNLLRSSSFHRVQLIDGPCWTLFIAGPRVGVVDGEGWGFLDTETDAYETLNERDRRMRAARSGQAGARHVG